jgi:CheY-like chemotaxis protein
MIYSPYIIAYSMKSIKNNRKILVIEDDAHIRNNVVEFLSLNEFDVVAAENGVQGLISYATFKPDLIICDIMMPEMDGYTFLEELQKRYPLNFTIIIFLTAKNSAADQRKGMYLGADDYIVKPFTFSDLLNAIETRFAKSDLRRESIEKAAEKMKQQSYSTPFHEFNTCLNGILTGSQFLIGNAEKLPLDIETQSILDVIKRSGLRLSRAINNFILSKELESKNYFPFIEDVPVTYVVNSIVNIASNHNRSADLNLSVEGVSIKTDKFLLKRVIEELTENAFKFTQKGDPVNWNVSLNPNAISLEIEYPNKFRFNEEKFEQIAAYNQFTVGSQVLEGLGLGLFLSQKILEVLGFELQFTEKNPSNLSFKILFNGDESLMP